MGKAACDEKAYMKVLGATTRRELNLVTVSISKHGSCIICVSKKVLRDTKSNCPTDNMSRLRERSTTTIPERRHRHRGPTSSAQANTPRSSSRGKERVSLKRRARPNFVHRVLQSTPTPSSATRGQIFVASVSTTEV